LGKNWHYNNYSGAAPNLDGGAWDPGVVGGPTEFLGRG